MTDIAGKGGVTRVDIDRLLPRFYAAIRRDDRLGPIFHRHVGESDADWARHLTKIGDFWANVMLIDRSYQGNPMQVHLGLTDIQPTDFDIWLDLFDRAAHATLSEEKATVFSLLAHRIGRSLAMGIAQARSPGPPSLSF